MTGVVVNRTHQVPEALRGPELNWGDAAGGVVEAGAGAGAGTEAGPGGAAEAEAPTPGAMAAMRRIHESRVELAAAEEKQINRFVRRFPDAPLTHVPSMSGGVTSTDDLRTLAKRILPALD